MNMKYGKNGQGGSNVSEVDVKQKGAAKEPDTNPMKFKNMTKFFELYKMKRGNARKLYL